MRGEQQVALRLLQHREVPRDRVERVGVEHARHGELLEEGGEQLARLVSPRDARPHHHRLLPVGRLEQIAATVGLSTLLQNLALVLFSADPLIVQTAYSRVTFSLGPAVVRVPQLIAFGGSGVAAVLLYWFLQRTDAGRAIRAASQNREAAVLMGIDVQRTYLLAFGIGSACLGVAASLMVPFYYTSPTVGLWFGLVSFVVVVLGGMGNFIGALVGGLIIGLTEAFGAAILPGSLSRVFTFAIFILALLFRPQGLFGGSKK